MWIIWQIHKLLSSWLDDSSVSIPLKNSMQILCTCASLTHEVWELRDRFGILRIKKPQFGSFPLTFIYLVRFDSFRNSVLFSLRLFLVRFNSYHGNVNWRIHKFASFHLDDFIIFFHQTIRSFICIPQIKTYSWWIVGYISQIGHGAAEPKTERAKNFQILQKKCCINCKQATK